LGDTYSFYSIQHGRDSDNDKGAALSATVRYCDNNMNNACPLGNAFASLIFGAGFATDDVIAHEFTHRVTALESKLIYANASGAINESLSDIWGEFVDLSNSSGTDTTAVRWDVGEDLAGGRIRSMKNPPALSDPDRLGSPLYVAPTMDGSNDSGGVHSNSGVNNKLCYLLTDGDTFNGYTISGMGIPRIAELYYEANVNLLTSASGWTDLYNALRQAAVKLGWSAAERNNLCAACVAVEIATLDNGWSWYVDQSAGCFPQTGIRNCSNIGAPFATVSQGYQTAAPTDTLFIRTGSYIESLTFNKLLRVQAYDGPVTIGR
jgi:Zn-dependent metalloprotease